MKVLRPNIDTIVIIVFWFAFLEICVGYLAASAGSAIPDPHVCIGFIFCCFLAISTYSAVYLVRIQRVRLAEDMVDKLLKRHCHFAVDIRVGLESGKTYDQSKWRNRIFSYIDHMILPEIPGRLSKYTPSRVEIFHRFDRLVCEVLKFKTEKDFNPNMPEDYLKSYCAKRLISNGFIVRFLRGTSSSVHLIAEKNRHNAIIRFVSSKVTSDIIRAVAQEANDRKSALAAIISGQPYSDNAIHLSMDKNVLLMKNIEIQRIEKILNI